MKVENLVFNEFGKIQKQKMNKKDNICCFLYLNENFK